MLLGDVLAVEAAPVEITGLAYDNRRAAPGTLFFCVPGFTRDGHDFAPDAIARGAAALVVERPSTTCARRWPRPPRASTATRPPGCGWPA
jgi:UDP-N-acetylmuramyl pentapeptide synthase